RDALWEGLVDGTLDVVATDHVPDRLAVEKADAARGVPFDRISNGAPGIETLLGILYSEGVVRGRITFERMVDLLSTTPARLFGLPSKGAIKVGKVATPRLSVPKASRARPAAALHPTAAYPPAGGMPEPAPVRS